MYLLSGPCPYSAGPKVPLIRLLLPRALLFLLRYPTLPAFFLLDWLLLVAAAAAALPRRPAVHTAMLLKCYIVLDIYISAGRRPAGVLVGVLTSRRRPKRRPDGGGPVCIRARLSSFSCPTAFRPDGGRTGLGCWVLHVPQNCCRAHGSAMCHRWEFARSRP